MREKYPEASQKRNHYRDLGNKLKANRSAIESSVNGCKGGSFSLDPQDVDGEYYNRYATKRDDWFAIHGQIITKFDTFLTDIDTCIARASSLESLWANRIGVMERYDD